MRIPPLLLSLTMTAASLASSAAGVAYPPTAKHPATNTYHGTAVVDDYIWLEDFDGAGVKDWNAAQNKFSRAYLDKLPMRDAIAARLKELYASTSPTYSIIDRRGGLFFAMKFQPPAQQPWLVTLKSPDDLASEKVVLDPNKLNTKGTTTIDWVVPSPDGKLVAVSLSENGSEEGTLHFLDVATGQMRTDRVPRVQYPTGGGSVAWTPDSTGVHYTRYPHAGERAEDDLNFYQQIWFHRLGTPVSEDRYELGKEFPRIAEIAFETSHDGKHILATVANGDGGDYEHHLLGADNEWHRLTRFSDGVKWGRFGPDGSLYLMSLHGAPHGKVLRLAPDETDLAKATVAVPESEGVISAVCPSEHGLYVAELVGGPSQLRFVELPSGTSRLVPTPPVSSVGGLHCEDGDRLLFRNVSYVAPPAWMIFDPASGQAKATALSEKSPVDFSDVEVVRSFATSKDGTKVPMNILRKKGTQLDYSNPTLLYAYGGYGISMSPRFSVAGRVWFDHGGVYVVANLRGGGEYGEEWHKAGNLTKKQNVFDDFAACAEYLIKTGYTTRERLATEGGSNGGLLMGAFLTQHPDLARAVVSHVGIYDSLRTELEPNGEFNITEFGTVKDEAQFRALLAYSPYHNVVDGTKYPAVLFMTGDHDGRVNPFHSRKMTARLQAATGSDRPILLRTTSSAGHGMGTALDERIAQQTDVFAFLFDQLGVK
jgi:prolyl oligopeptidase